MQTSDEYPSRGEQVFMYKIKSLNEEIKSLKNKLKESVLHRKVCERIITKYNIDMSTEEIEDVISETVSETPLEDLLPLEEAMNRLYNKRMNKSNNSN